MIEVTKTIMVKSEYDTIYLLTLQNNGISISVREDNSEDEEIIYCSKETAKALARSLSELAQSTV